jgi:hypothetical protein
MRDQEKCPKILTSRRRGGLFKHQNNSFFDLGGYRAIFLTAARLNVSDKSKLQADASDRGCLQQHEIFPEFCHFGKQRSRRPVINAVTPRIDWAKPIVITADGLPHH